MANPESVAIACPMRFSPRATKTRRGASGAGYAVTSFAALDEDATRIAAGLLEWGVPPGTRLALLVRPGIDFVTLVFALLRAGMVAILIDPGMGRRKVLARLAETDPEGFLGPPLVQAVRALVRGQFPRAKWNVTVGRSWGWGGVTLDALRQRGDRTGNVPTTSAESPAAIIFTSGSTGPAKGVLYTHGMFDTQVSEIQSAYDIEPGGVDLSCFPLFGLFNAAMGVTTVMPEMDFSRPASADPRKLLAAARDWHVTQAFASPAVWRKLAAHCHKSGERIPSLRQIFSCGAPVPADVLRATLECVAPSAKMHTPYGATECLPVATIEAAEVLSETARKTDAGGGICVGRKFDTLEWRVIRITDEPIATIGATEELPPGEIGELIVRGPQASPLYMTRIECNAESKIADCGLGNAEPACQSEIRYPKSEIAWHRLGDVGYLDEYGRFWYCGRKSQRVETVAGTLFTECVEGVFNHAAGERTSWVHRCALVGIDARPRQTPVIVYEPKLPAGNCVEFEAPYSMRTPGQIADTIPGWLRQVAQRHPMTRSIRHFLRHDDLPVDVRHNAKINREQLAAWAAKRLPELR